MSKKKIVSIVVSWALVLACMIFIFCMSAQNATESSMTSGGIIEKILKVFYPDFDTLDAATQFEIIDGLQTFVRKAAHFSMYAVLGCLLFNAYSRLTGNMLIVTVVSFITAELYAASDEFHQYFVPGRSCEIRDVAIDSSGALTGILVLLLIFVIVRKIKNRRYKKNERLL